MAPLETRHHLDNSQPRSVLHPLAQGKGTYLILVFRPSLRPLQGCSILPLHLPPPHKIHTVSFHDWDLVVKIPIRPTSDSGEKGRCNTHQSPPSILFMEANFNAVMKLLIGHRMVCNAILAWAIPQECFVSWLEHTVIQVSLNWCLIADTSWQ